MNSCWTWLRNSWRSVDVDDGVQTMQRWWLVTCGECLCVVDGGKVRDSMAALVWPQPAQPCHTIPSPARALASAAGELLGHWPPAAC